MQLASYLESLVDPLFAIVDLALERPLASLTLAALAFLALLTVG